jgi:transcriptional regulator GlxA family with amidase domain
VSPTRVAVLALEHLVSFDLGIAVQAFARGPGPAGEPAGFTLVTCGERAGRVQTADGFALDVPAGLEALEDAELIVVPGRAFHDALPSEAVADALRAAHARGARLASICVGAFDLAATGLLDGRRATTHWAYADAFRERFPAVELVPDALYVDEGDVLSSAGLAAGMDLFLHIVRQQEGAAAAAALARWNVVALHRDGGQAQFVPSPVVHVGDDLAPTLEWARGRLDRPLDAAALAAHAHVSPRTLARRFATEVGTTPKGWITAQRIALARELLETTDASVDEVAQRCGLGSAPVLRRHLSRLVHTTPTGYRGTFRGRGAAAD